MKRGTFQSAGQGLVFALSCWRGLRRIPVNPVGGVPRERFARLERVLWSAGRNMRRVSRLGANHHKLFRVPESGANLRDVLAR